MTTLVVASLFAVAAHIPTHQQPLAPPPENKPAISRDQSETLSRIAAEQFTPSACAPATAACDQVAFGELGPGDCTLSDGTYLDGLFFQGTAGDFVDVVLWPLDSTLTNPTLLIKPPSNDASPTPVVIGGNGGAWLSYVLSSSGAWGIGVGTHDLFGKGRYAVKVYCSTTNTSTCVAQNLTCGQTIGWTLTAQSCSFTNTQRPYADHFIYGTTGDFFSAQVASNVFSPLVAIYDDASSQPVAVGQLAVNGVSSVTYSVPRDGWYDVLATPSSGSSGGFYTVSVSCSNSGCIPPLIVQQPLAPKTVRSGDRVTLSAQVKSFGPTTYTWYDIDGLSMTVVGNGLSLTTAPLTSTHTFKVVVHTQCGDEESVQVTVTPTPGKRRAAHH